MLALLRLLLANPPRDAARTAPPKRVTELSTRTICMFNVSRTTSKLTLVDTRTGRLPRKAGRPVLSVVVASDQPESTLDECLNALRVGCAPAGIELLVVRADAPARIASMRRAHSDVRFVAAPAGSLLEELRSIGANHAGGDIVAIVDDGRPVDEGLVQDLIESADLHSASPAGRRK